MKDIDKNENKEKFITCKSKVGMSFYVKSQAIISDKDTNNYISDPKSDVKCK